MTWWEALVLGVVQGVTEFFPVSSSGHLVMTEHFLGLELPGIGFAIVVHTATLLSVIVVYRERLVELVRGMVVRGEESSWPYLLKLLVATIPAGTAGLLFRDAFEARFDDPAFTGTMLLVTGSFLWSTRWSGGERRFGWPEALPVVIAMLIALVTGNVIPFLAVLVVEAILMVTARRTAPVLREDEPGMGSAILMGLAQAVAIFPGISRSGSTVVTGLWRRIDPVRAAEFSFLMSIPAILGAALLDVPRVASEGFGVPVAALGVGFAAAAISGVLAIRYFVAMLKKQNFYTFAWYCWAIGTVFLLSL